MGIEAGNNEEILGYHMRCRACGHIEITLVPFCLLGCPMCHEGIEQAGTGKGTAWNTMELEDTIYPGWKLVKPDGTVKQSASL